MKAAGAVETGVVAGVVLAALMALVATAAEPPPSDDPLLEALDRLVPASRPVTLTAGPGREAPRPRRTLQAIDSGPDLLLLRTDSPGSALWPDHTAADARLFTVEAFREARDRLAPGGWFGVLAADERLFVRAVLTAWEAFGDESGTGAPGAAESPFTNATPPSRRSWLLKKKVLAAGDGDYEFLLLVEPRPIDERRARQVQAITQDLPVKVLLGPGFPPVTRYSLLPPALASAEARSALRLELSRRAEVWVEIDPVHDGAGDFFRIVRAPRPAAKWLLTACIAGIIAVAMFPLRRHRRVDAPGAGTHPPLPVLLGPFVLAAAGAGIAATSLAAAAALAPIESAALLVVMGLGGLGAWIVAGPSDDRSSSDEGEPSGSPGARGETSSTALAVAAPLVGAFLLAGMPAVVPAVFGSTASAAATAPAARLGLLLMLGLLLGAAGGFPIAWTARRLRVALPALLPWAGVMFVLAAIAAPALVHWITGAAGAAGNWWVWMAGAGAHALGAVAVLWIRGATHT